MKYFFLLTIMFAAMTIKAVAQEQNIILKTASGDINGVLLKPVTKKKVPVVLLISGSGPTDKDGNQPSMQNNSLKMLAEALSRNDIASLRFDKRGIGGSRAAGKKEADLRFDDLVADTDGWIDLLAADKSFSKVIVAGHSEGALIGLIAAARNKHAAKYISIAGTGFPADEILKKQMNSLPPNVKDVVFPMLDKLKKGETFGDVPPSLNALFRPSVQPYMISWFKYDPRVEIKNLKIPVLIVQGDRDIQVSVADAESLKAASNKAELKIIANMNHVLKNIETSDRTEQMKIYNQPDAVLNGELVTAISTFVRR